MKYEESLQYVRNAVDNEGFGYAFLSYDDFSQIKDEKFQGMKKRMVVAMQEMDLYLKENTLEDES